MEGVFQTDRVKYLKDKMLSEPRYASIEQALIITDSTNDMRISRGSFRERWH